MDHNETPAGAQAVVPALCLILAVWGCAVYANLSFYVSDPADYRWFPPFEPYLDDNDNWHLGGEYFNIAHSLIHGQGYSNPFTDPTGPTAWMPPVLPTFLAGLLWVCDGDRDSVAVVVVFVQVCVLTGTGLLVLALARHTTRRLRSSAAVAVFLVSVVSSFHLCFQNTHDGWLVLLAIDLLIGGLCWCAPLASLKRAAAWGLFGGFTALINPIVGFAWGVCSLIVAFRQKAWLPVAVALFLAGLALTPWTVRNYRVFGRLVPIKSNAGYELYQSQCLQTVGLLRSATLAAHPYTPAGHEHRELRELGEIAFVERKKQQFLRAVRSDPLNFLTRIGHRFAGATLWYEPFDADEPGHRPWRYTLTRLGYPLPFCALLILLATAMGSPLGRPQWIVVAVYLCYLLPYIIISYYERYALPLLGVKALLFLWAGDRLLSWRKAPSK